MVPPFFWRRREKMMGMCILSFFLGVFSGVAAIALVSANREDRDGQQ